MDEGSESKFWPFLSRLFRAKPDVPLEEAVKEASADGELSQEALPMIINILRLGDKKVYECMVPRTDVVFVSADASIEETARLMGQYGYSRIPAYHETRDQIVGVVYSKDLFAALLHHDSKDLPIKERMNPPYFVAETQNIQTVFQEMRNRKVHMAVVVDEYGGTAGLITLEDILEEIVGDIEDERDAMRMTENDITMVSEKEWLVSGRTSLEDLSENLKLELDSDEVETIGGYLTEKAGHVPGRGDAFVIQGISFTIEDADPKQVKMVRVVMTEDAPAQDNR